MKRICAWCNKTLADNKKPDGRITHGACTKCAQKELAKVGLKLSAKEKGKLNNEIKD